MCPKAGSGLPSNLYIRGTRPLAAVFPQMQAATMAAACDCRSLSGSVHGILERFTRHELDGRSDRICQFLLVHCRVFVGVEWVAPLPLGNGASQNCTCEFPHIQLAHSINVDHIRTSFEF